MRGRGDTANNVRPVDRRLLNNPRRNAAEYRLDQAPALLGIEQSERRPPAERTVLLMQPERCLLVIAEHLVRYRLPTRDQITHRRPNYVE